MEFQKPTQVLLIELENIIETQDSWYFHVEGKRYFNFQAQKNYFLLFIFSCGGRKQHFWVLKI